LLDVVVGYIWKYHRLGFPPQYNVTFLSQRLQTLIDGIRRAFTEGVRRSNPPLLPTAAAKHKVKTILGTYVEFPTLEDCDNRTGVTPAAAASAPSMHISDTPTEPVTTLTGTPAMHNSGATTRTGTPAKKQRGRRDNRIGKGKRAVARTKRPAGAPTMHISDTPTEPVTTLAGTPAVHNSGATTRTGTPAKKQRGRRDNRIGKGKRAVARTKRPAGAPAGAAPTVTNNTTSTAAQVFYAALLTPCPPKRKRNKNNTKHAKKTKAARTRPAGAPRPIPNTNRDNLTTIARKQRNKKYIITLGKVRGCESKGWMDYLAARDIPAKKRWQYMVAGPCLRADPQLSPTQMRVLLRDYERLTGEHGFRDLLISFKAGTQQGGIGDVFVNGLDIIQTMSAKVTGAK